MAIRVTPVRGPRTFTVSAAHLAERFAADPRIAGPLGEKLRSRYAASINNALIQVASVLEEGMSNPSSGGSRQVSAVDADGSPVVIRTIHWPRLNADYLARKRVKRYWVNTRTLAGRVASEASRGADVQVSADEVRRSHHRGKVRLGYSLSIQPGLSYVLRYLVAEPFVLGDKKVASVYYPGLFQVQDRGSIGRLVFPETGPYRRPFVAQLSAALGRRALTALRRL